jgi:sporulation-control protein spo0M
MFDFLKGGKATIEMTIDHPSQVYKLGDTIHATVTVKGVKDVKIHEGRIGLFFKEEYQYRHTTRDRDSNGHMHTNTHTSWATNEQEVTRQVIIPEGNIPANYNQTFEFSTTIPSNAPPTCDGGKIVRVSWYIKATLGRKLATDFEDKVDLKVMNPAPGKATQLSEYGYPREPDTAGMVLVLPGKEFKLGETIQGKLGIMPKKDFSSSEVRLELVRKEYVPRDDGNESVAEIKTQLCGKREIKAGEDFVLPFSLTIPDPSPITYSSNNASISYTIKGVLGRVLHTDPVVEEEIFIYHPGN